MTLLFPTFIKYMKESAPIMRNEHEAKHFSHVVFDVDGTLSIEGLDVLAEAKGLGEQVRAITEEGMNGGNFHGSLSRRLDMLAPTRDEMEWLAKQYIEGVVPGARETIYRLHEMGKDVRMVSGGFADAIVPLALELGIAPDRVHANTMWFESGRFCGFDPDNELAYTGGKPRLLRQLGLEGAIVNIGDGSTDAEIKTEGVSDRFILFGGLSGVREGLVAAADIVVADVDLRAILPHILRHEDGRIS